jgi:hypothetical protein
MTLNDTRLAVRAGISVTLIVSGYVHAYLYVDGYRSIPAIGPSFLLQASLSFALAVLILAGGPWWLTAAAAALALGALAAFALSRTVGVFGFTEVGWQPTPYGALAVIAEVLTMVLGAAMLIRARTNRTHPSMI